MLWLPLLRRVVFLIVLILAIAIAVGTKDWRWGAAFFALCTAGSFALGRFGF